MNASPVALLAAEIARLENCILVAFLRTFDGELGDEVQRIVERRRRLCRPQSPGPSGSQP